VAVRLRLTRVGGKKDPIWRVVVADQRAPRDGRLIELATAHRTGVGLLTVMAEQRSSSEVPAEAPRRLLEYLAEGLVDEPEKVSVEQFEEDDGTIVLELCVAAEDYGRVIGRGGRTAHALRTVVKAAATGEGCHVLVDIVD